MGEQPLELNGQVTQLKQFSGIDQNFVSF